MKTTKPPESMSHPDELLLLYAEDSLGPSDAQSVEQHLSGCTQCASTVEKLAETIRVLKTHGDAFCPEPWELYEFVFRGEDPDESIGKHVQRCELCTSLCERWSSQINSEILSDRLLAQISDRSRTRDPRMTGTGTARFRFKDRFLKRLVFPTLGAGAAVAAVLMVFLLMPGEIPQSLVAPSTVTWEKIPKPKAFQASRYRTAIIIALKGFPTRWSQARVDSLYSALTPTMELSEKFDILPPGVVSETIQQGRRGLRTKDDMVALLRKELDVKRVAVIVVSPAQDKMKIQGEFIDSQGCTTLNRSREKLVGKKELDMRIKQMVTELMVSKKR